jgi:hypothetical protein
MRSIPKVNLNESLRTKRPLIVCQREDAQNEKLYKINGVIDDCGRSKSDENLIKIDKFI